jgi:ankyrin repeat protein
MTALHWAAAYDDIDTVRLLLEHSAHPDMGTRYGVSALYFAALNGNAAMLQAMIDAGGDPEWARPGGETLLMTAARAGDVDAVRLLVDHGADVNAREGVRGQTALMWAVLENHPVVIDLLLAGGADVNAETTVDVPDGMEQSITDREGNPRLSADIGAHGPGIYRARAIPTPSGGMTPLLVAAREGHLPIARTLVAAGAEVNLHSANDTGPLVVAIINNHIDLAIYLLDAGADPNASDQYHARTPLWAAVDMRNLIFSDETARPRPNPVDPWDLIVALLDAGADPNARTNTPPIRGFMQQTASWVNFDGQTPFIRAAQSGDVALMRKLLDYGADPNIATYEGSTALMAAAGVNWVVGQTYSRSDAEYLEAVSLCLDLGGDVNGVNQQGFTAMHGAANRGFDEMVRLLAGNGSRLDASDSEGRTPMTFAEGVFLAVQPPVYKPETVALLEELLIAAGLPSGRSVETAEAGQDN